MADTYSPSLGLQIQTVGGNDSTWGTINNTNIGTLIEEAIAGRIAVAVAGSDVTLTTTQGASNQARNAVVVLTGTPGATRNINFPDVEKLTLVLNSTNATQTLKAGAGTSVSLAVGEACALSTDGATNAVALLRGVMSYTGDVTGTGFGSVALTIASNAVTTTKIIDDAVTLAKMANMATASLLGRNTAGTGDPEVLSASTARSLLSLTTGTSGAVVPYLNGANTHSGACTFSSTVALQGAVACSGDLTLTGTVINNGVFALNLPSASYDDLGSLGADSVIRITPVGLNVTITGIAAPTGGTTYYVINESNFGYTITLKHEDASSSAANRFEFQGDIVISPKGAVILWYDVIGPNPRWRCLAQYP